MRHSGALAGAAFVAMSAIALAGCGTGGAPADSSKSSQAPATFNLTGTVEVQAISNGKPGAPCHPDEESTRWPSRPGSTPSGVKVGGDVTVTDSAGHVVGLGKVFVGEYMDSGHSVSSYCTVPFKVNGVTDGDKVYGIAVAELPKKEYLRAELDHPISMVVPD